MCGVCDVCTWTVVYEFFIDVHQESSSDTHALTSSGTPLVHLMVTVFFKLRPLPNDSSNST